MEFQVRDLIVFLLFSVVDGFGCFWIRSLHKDYPFNAGVPQESFLGPTLLLMYINDVPGNIICDTIVCADDTNLCSKCDQASGLWEQLELASKLESDL